MKESKANILINNTKWLYISKIASQILSLFTIVLVIRKLPVDIFGTYSLLLGSFFVFEILTISAVSNVFNRYIPELVTSKNYCSFKKTILFGMLFSSILIISAVLILHIHRNSFSKIFNITGFDNYIVSFYTYCFATFLKRIIDTILKALLLHKKTAILTIINSIIKLILYLIFINKLTVATLLYIESILAALFVIQGFYIYFTYNAHLITISDISNKTLEFSYKRAFRYGLLSTFNELGVGIIGKTSDYFIVAALSNPFQIGIFAFAHKLYGMVFNLLPFKDFQTIVRPLFFKMYYNEYDNNEFNKMFNLMAKTLLPLYSFPAVYFLFFGREIISIIFDPKYSPAYWVTVVILMSNIFTGFFYPLGLTVMLKEKMEYNLYSKIIIVFSIFAGIFGMKYFGVIGIAIASLLGGLFKNILIYFFMRKFKETRYNIKEYFNYLSMLLFLVPFSFLNIVNNNMFNFIIISVAFTIYSGFIFLILHPFTKYDIDIFKKIMPKKPFFNFILNYIYRPTQKVRRQIILSS